MHPAQIKAALTIAGYKQTEAAEECGVKPTTVGAVINGRSRSKKVEEWISEKTGVALRDLWPQWYGQGDLVLSADERELVQLYRSLSISDRLALIEGAKRLGAGASLRSGQQVSADRGSVAAGGDVSIGSSARRRGK